MIADVRGTLKNKDATLATAALLMMVFEVWRISGVTKEQARKVCESHLDGFLSEHSN